MTNNRIRARMPRLLLAALVCLAGPIFAQTRLNYSILFPSSHRNSVLAAEWASRPADAQKVFEQVNAEWINTTGAAWDEMDKAGTTFASGLGDTAIPLSPRTRTRAGRRQWRPCSTSTSRTRRPRDSRRWML